MTRLHAHCVGWCNGHATGRAKRAREQNVRDIFQTRRLMCKQSKVQLGVLSWSFIAFVENTWHSKCLEKFGDSFVKELCFFRPANFILDYKTTIEWVRGFFRHFDHVPTWQIISITFDFLKYSQSEMSKIWQKGLLLK